MHLLKTLDKSKNRESDKLLYKFVDNIFDLIINYHLYESKELK